MSDGKSLSVPVNIPTDVLTAVMEKVVEAQASEIHNEFKKALSQKETELQALLRAMDDRIQQERDRIDTKVNEIDAKKRDADTALETLKGKVSTRVNTFVVPGVIVTFVLIALAIWTAVGGWSVIDRVKTLKSNVATTTSDYSTAAKDLDTIQKQINDLKATVSNVQTTAGQAATMIALEKRVADLEAAKTKGNTAPAEAKPDHKRSQTK
jgi:DNA anti-recombination protein RmuC